MCENDAASHHWPKPGKAGSGMQPAHTSGETKAPKMASLYEDMVLVGGTEMQD